MKLSKGDIFHNKYRIIDFVGAGTFGKVYKVKDIKLDRIEALKILDGASIPLELFINEIHGIKNLEHPNIVKLYDFDYLETEFPFMAMEFVKGKELAQLLVEEYRLSEKRTLNIIAQVLDALVETHSQNIIHCDLKPENILLTKLGIKEDFVKLLDFGIAKVCSERTNKSNAPLMGTPHYMAPEQIRKESLGPWTDIYSVGLITIELLTGQLVVTGKTTKEILLKQLQQPITLPPILENSALAPILLKATHKNPIERYHNALEFYNDINKILSNNPSDIKNQFTPTQSQPSPAVLLFANTNEIKSNQIPTDSPNIPLLNFDAENNNQKFTSFNTHELSLLDTEITSEKKQTQQELANYLDNFITRSADTKRNLSINRPNHYHQNNKQRKKTNLKPIIITTIIIVMLATVTMTLIIPKIKKNQVLKNQYKLSLPKISSTLIQATSYNTCISLNISKSNIISLRIISSPQNTTISLNNRMVCRKTPCILNLFGKPQNLQLVASHKNKQTTIDLLNHKSDEPIFIDLTLNE